MSDHVQHRIRMYGNITSPRKEGVLGLSALASVIGVIVAILVFVTMPLGIWVQTVVVVLGAGAMSARDLQATRPVRRHSYPREIFPQWEFLRGLS